MLLHIGVIGVWGVAGLGLVLAGWVMGVVGYVVIPCTWIIVSDGGLVESRPFAGDYMFINWAGTVNRLVAVVSAIQAKEILLIMTEFFWASVKSVAVETTDRTAWVSLRTSPCRVGLNPVAVEALLG